MLIILLIIFSQFIYNRNKLNITYQPRLAPNLCTFPRNKLNHLDRMGTRAGTKTQQKRNYLRVKQTARTHTKANNQPGIIYYMDKITKYKRY